MESLGGVSDLELVPINFDEACAFIAEHHRHHDPPVGCKFCVGVARAVVIVGVAVVGRPVARSAADTWTAEVTRVCVFDPVAKDTNGGHASGANSMLYAACWRAARALGYRKLITYELPEEGGGELARRRMEVPRGDRRRFVAQGIQATRGYASYAGQTEVGEDMICSCGNTARYIDETGALTCGIRSIKAGRDSIRFADVPALLKWARRHLAGAHCFDGSDDDLRTIIGRKP